MAFTHGKKAALTISDAGGTPRVLTTFTDSTSGLPGAKELSEVTAYGDEGHRFIPGLENVTFSASGSWDSTATTGVHAVLTSIRSAEEPVAFEFGPEGTGSGKVKLSGVCWLSNYTVDTTVADKVPWSADFQVDGAVTIGTYS